MRVRETCTVHLSPVGESLFFVACEGAYKQGPRLDVAAELLRCHADIETVAFRQLETTSFAWLTEMDAGRVDVDQLAILVTPLFRAAMGRDLNVARFLLQNGAQVNRAASNGMTPLHAVCASGFKAALERGYAVRVSGYKAEPVPDYEEDSDSAAIQMLQLLHEAGADLEAADEDGTAPLHTACRCGNLAAAQFLCESGVGIDTVGTFWIWPWEGGEPRPAWKPGAVASQATPLYMASIVGNVDIVELLLQHGARADAKSGSGLTALQAAERGVLYDTSEVVGLLRSVANESAPMRAHQSTLNWSAPVTLQQWGGGNDGEGSDTSSETGVRQPQWPSLVQQPASQDVQTTSVQRPQPAPQLRKMLFAFMLALTYLLRSCVYAMFTRVAIECVRAAAVYGGLYILARHVVGRSSTWRALA